MEEEEEEEEEALQNHCRRMISRVRNKRHPRSSSSERGRHAQHRGANGRERRTGVVAGDHFRDLRECNVDLPFPYSTSSPNLICQGPEDLAAPPLLLLMLKLKTFNEKVKRRRSSTTPQSAVCERLQASLALESFIRRKKTQLQFQALKGRLNTHFNYGECARWGSLGEISQSLLMPTTGFGRNNLVCAGGRLACILLPGNLKLLCCCCSGSEGFWDGGLMWLLLPLCFLLLKVLLLRLQSLELNLKTRLDLLHLDSLVPARTKDTSCQCLIPNPVDNLLKPEQQKPVKDRVRSRPANLS
ncbi:hypothetical protein FQN60_009853 [Etheostoma spectabile]|uniref:Uncharacterized protein n=1 Tax=Etheostoma spectabile TaxID=54343 RepID=A0A5J5D189_9PERO|nr:hypothetical protein FQN60_009853 [Etheostoma spectabile]